MIHFGHQAKCHFAREAAGIGVRNVFLCRQSDEVKLMMGRCIYRIYGIWIQMEWMRRVCVWNRTNGAFNRIPSKKMSYPTFLSLSLCFSTFAMFSIITIFVENQKLNSQITNPWIRIENFPYWHVLIGVLYLCKRHTSDLPFGRGVHRLRIMFDDGYNAERSHIILVPRITISYNAHNTQMRCITGCQTDRCLRMNSNAPPSVSSVGIITFIALDWYSQTNDTIFIHTI